jgi:predicted N-acyltransferase
MADGGPTLAITACRSMADFDPAEWNALGASSATAGNPFIRHEFLSALERSQSLGAGTGWEPMYLALKDGETLIGAIPAYLKQHSQGEYIFDHHWADAYERAGGQYYPKLLAAAPFTPAEGPRLLAASDDARLALARGLAALADRMGLSVAQINFCTRTDETAAAKAGYLLREGVQYHWFNRGYGTYEEFLGALSSRKRKAIRRERREAQESGLTIRKLRGAEITEAHWDAFWLFYQDTGNRKWGRPYLTRTFFRLVAESMADDFLFIVAERDGTPVAGALNFIGGDTLYGRYWGCTEHHAFLHFELCYHQAIDFAIEHGLAKVEAGAQGEHKIARGYEPVATRSMHHIVNEGFRAAIEDYLTREREGVTHEIDVLSTYTPFKKSAKEE